MLANVRARVATPHGSLRIEFDGDVDLGELVRLVAAEQQCCSFFAFALTIDARGIALEIGAPDEATVIVGAVFGKAS